MKPKDARAPLSRPPEDAPRRQRGRPREDKGEAATVRSLDRAMHLLSTLAGMQGATLSGLAQAAGESPATVYRVLTTLEAHRMTEFDEAAQTWHVGAGAFLVGATFLRRTSLVERARPVLRALMEATGETANLGVEVSSGAGGAVLFVSQVETHAPIRAFFPPGTTSPLHASGIGKVLLAHMPPARAARLLGGALPGYTPRTITDPGALAAELAAVRARGHAVDDEERNEGMRCLAAPVRDAHGETVAGLSVSGPVSRIAPGRLPEIAAPVMAAAMALSSALGHRSAASSGPGSSAHSSGPPAATAPRGG